MYPVIDNIRMTADFATVYQWDVKFLTWPAAPIAGGIGWPDDADLNFRCESTDIPVSTNSSITVAIRGHKVKQPGIQEYGMTFTLHFVETVDNRISHFIRNWREACSRSQTAHQFTKAELDATILITRLNRQLLPIWEYKLIGCWLESYTLPNLDGSTSDALKPGMTLSYDYFLDGSAGASGPSGNIP